MNGINILLVASNLQYCREARQFFAQSKYELTIANDLQTAFSLIQKTNFAVIVCQVRASSIDGFAMLQQLQAEPQTAKIPFIFLSEGFHSHEHRQAMEMGADDILFLPYSFLDIEGIVSTRLHKNQALLKDSQKELEHLRYSITTFLPHEMRTALTGIIAASELLFKKHESLDSLILQEMVGCIHVSGKKLSHLTHNFLLYSELKSLASDRSKITNLRTNSTFDVKNAIAKTVWQYAQKYSRQSDFILELENASVQMGLTNLNKLVGELIDNACKFSSPGTSIKVTAKTKDNYLTFAITNYGRGMTAEQIDKIGLGMQFERSTYEQQGFGLGLVIARDLARLHGGNLAIESVVNDKTLVRVSLPLANSESLPISQNESGKLSAEPHCDRQNRIKLSS